ncbi:YraN family protein [Vogesella sp. LIG4]|uniref:YraN family protein n=1 Tax=Vogesella sp. LIG4 TaxID=1192162 RepID=UPI00081F7729|nr:YraN family protein [Vogesella sp. LIG4]SCK14127.1 putative endonuclease [Vogesella sp. LIG4]
MSRSTGSAFEQQAARFLQQQGLKLVCSNWHCRFGEIDLIMRDGASLVFVEVRARRSASFGGAAASIGAAKRQKLTAAANLYLSQQHIDAPCRFDAVLFNGDAPVEWLQNIIG